MATLRGSQGGGYESRGKFYIRVTTAPREPRKDKRAPWATTLDETIARGKAVQALVNRLLAAGKLDFIDRTVEIGAVADEAKMVELGTFIDAVAGGEIVKDDKPSTVMTFKKFADRWTSGDLAKQYPDHVKIKQADDDKERLAKYVFPALGDLPIKSITRAQCDAVLAKLPSILRPATRRHVAQVINRVFRLAVFAEVLPHSPLPAGWLPKVKKDSLAKESLQPSEEALLLAASEDKVPLRYRVLYAVLHREGIRKGEARLLTWSDLTLGKDRGTLSLDKNKTDRPRSWVLTPSIAKMLGRFKVLQRGKRGPEFPRPTDLVFTDITWSKLAPMYRSHCEGAGIDRARLYQKKANKLRLRAHDARAFFATASIVSGKDVLWITDRTGHTSLGQLRNYERDARRWRELGEGAPVDPMTSIPEFADSSSVGEVSVTRGGEGNGRESTIEKCTGRDLNPHALRRRNLNGEEPNTVEESRDVAASLSDVEAPSEGLPTLRADTSDAVEEALGVALREAAIAGRFDVVAALARELEARRLAGASNVVSLDTARRKRT